MHLATEIQVYAERAMNRWLKAARKHKVSQGALVALDTSGAVRAMVGASDYGLSQFNRVTAMRQPGSAFKPLIYLAALEQGSSMARAPARVPASTIIPRQGKPVPRRTIATPGLSATPLISSQGCGWAMTTTVPWPAFQAAAIQH